MQNDKQSEAVITGMDIAPPMLTQLTPAIRKNPKNINVIKTNS
jgi:hypothetical protein